MDGMQGTRLRRLRKRTGKTQESVAAEIGVSKATYSAWETGRNDLRGCYVVPLCRCLGCSPNDIFGYEGTPSPVMPYLMEDAYYEFFELYERTPANVREAVRTMMESTSKVRKPRGRQAPRLR
ncbi:helix-turn-helix transcriptional regulator [Olsenella urininfantis]|uniref:helix-turn-helix transcriptional regulator n=1 Tax=Olsenella urininfantis TaxID=1871033 RepID=UPI000984C0C4|nr:helix-turn-helix transcriptional regulator [Olsenella urininfantis]